MIKLTDLINEATRPEPDYKDLVKLLFMAFKHEPRARFYFNRNDGVVFFDLVGGAAYSPKKSTMREIFGGMNPIAVNRELEELITTKRKPSNKLRNFQKVKSK